MSHAPSTQAEREAQLRLEALAREDKWFLSAGEGTLWAPPFPRALHRPGFWDAAHMFHYPTPPLFTVALVNEDGTADPLEHGGSDWRPDRLRVKWRSRSGLPFTEFRYVLPGGRFCSAWRTEEELGWPNPAFRALTLTAFTSIPVDRVRDVRADDPGITWTSSLRDEAGQTLDVDTRLSVTLLPPRGRHPVAPGVIHHLAQVTSNAFCGALCSEGPPRPDWDLVPFAEQWQDRTNGGLGPTLPPPGFLQEGQVNLVTALPLLDVPARYGIAFIATLSVLGADSGPGQPPPSAPPMPRRSEARWRAMLASYPRLTCSDPHLDRYFDYRIYGLYLNRIEGGVGRIRRPAVAEGIQAFHLPGAPASTCHMMETRWSTDPGTAHGSLLNFLDAQREDGSLPGRLHVNHEVDDGFCHANWGDAFLAVDALHPKDDFLAVSYGGLSRYADWLRRERDPEASGMVTVVTPAEADQQHSPRFSSHPLKAVDATVYAYQLYQALEQMAHRLGRGDEAEDWRQRAEVTGGALLGRMWDQELGLFTDLDVPSGERTGVRTVTSFYPLLTDLLDEEHLSRLLAHLGDPATFGADYPVPSAPADDDLFSPVGFWDGQRRCSPWNGRVRPHANSHVVEGLIRQWHRGFNEAGPVAGRILRQFVRMMFHRGDPERANCFEHYNPMTGHASFFRGIDDHQRSWVADLMARGVTGVQPTSEALVVHPLPMGLQGATFRGLLRHHEVLVTVDGDDVTATVDGTAHLGRAGVPVVVPW